MTESLFRHGMQTRDLIARSDRGGELWQGGVGTAKVAYAYPFDLLVLCAEEHQLPRGTVQRYGRPRVLYAPNNDTLTPTKNQVAVADMAARQAAEAYVLGERVLVTCRVGWNRSGLVTALTLWYAGHGDGRQCVHRVQSRRANALSNDAFVRLLTAH